jgi:hypothetical protein
MSQKESSRNTTFKLSQNLHPIETNFKRKISILKELGGTTNGRKTFIENPVI